MWIDGSEPAAVKRWKTGAVTEFEVKGKEN